MAKSIFFKNLRNSFNQREDLDFSRRKKISPLNYPPRIQESIDYVKKNNKFRCIKIK